MTGSKAQIATRYWHTLRHLRAVQFYGRAWHKFYRPRANVRDAPDFRHKSGPWVLPLARPKMMVGADDFRFLNESGRVVVRADWNSPDREKLWLYNLHYFDDLNAADAEQRSAWHNALIDKWITENPAPHGNGWEPYPLSLRIVNWIKWALAGNQLRSERQQSLAVQIRFLTKRLEWHLLGNHLFVNAKALVFAGLFFEGREADGWLDKGLAILAREIPEQILADGGHFELSPMYHSIILEDILDLINLAGAHTERLGPAIVDSWRETAKQMLDWLAVMCHPDGEISFFNDAAFGIAAKPRLINAYAKQIGLAEGKRPKDGITLLKASGYIRVQTGEMVALLDVARIGPDYIPGHAHADTLSFELSMYGSRVIVNSGISQYGSGPQRLYQRSTKAHNTLEINGENSSEVWGSFRVARRALPIDPEIIEKPEEIIISCAHDGYNQLKGCVMHKRQWCFGDRSLEITDMITGKYDTAIARVYFHPDNQMSIDGCKGNLILPQGGKLGWHISGGNCALRESEYYPEFGHSVANSCLIANITNRRSQMTLKW